MSSSRFCNMSMRVKEEAAIKFKIRSGGKPVTICNTAFLSTQIVTRSNATIPYNATASGKGKRKYKFLGVRVINRVGDQKKIRGPRFGERTNFVKLLSSNTDSH